MKVSYDSKPKSLRAIGDGRCVYCWNIQEKTSNERIDDNVPDPTTTWECEQVIIYEPLTQNKILSAVISEKWDNNYEQKLLNECMSAQMGIYGKPESPKAKEKIERYHAFLQDRSNLKEMVDKDCADLGIK